MPYGIYDNSGRKIGEVRSAREQGIAIFLFLLSLPIVAVICVCVGLSQATDDFLRERRWATRAAIQTATAEVVTAQIQEGLSRLRQYRGTIAIGTVVRREEEFVQIESVEFASDGIRVHFEAETREYKWGKPEMSCIIWQGRNLVEGAGEWDDYNSPINEGLYILPNAQQFSRETLAPDPIETATLFRYEGYLVFPYSIIPDNANMIGPNTVYYFSYGCTALNPSMPLFDVLDFR